MEKTYFPIDLTEEGIVICCNEVDIENKLSGINSTFPVISIDWIPPKMRLPTFVNEFGSDIFLSFKQFSKTLSPIYVTDCGISISSSEEH